MQHVSQNPTINFRLLFLIFLCSLSGQLFSQPFANKTKIEADEKDKAFGHEAINIGDIDKDGHSDIAIGAPESDLSAFHAGRVNVYSSVGMRLKYVLVGEAGDQFGSSITGLGDINGDGYGDFAIGAPQNDHECTKDECPVTSTPFVIYVDDAGMGDKGQLYRVTRNGSPEDQVFFSYINHTDGFSGSFGQTNLMVYNYFRNWSNKDNEIFLIKAFTSERVSNSVRYTVPNPVPGYGPGYVMIFSGKDGQLIKKISGTESGAEFGKAIRGITDVNNDGLPDLIIGAPRSDSFSIPLNRTNFSSGAVFIYSLPAGTLITSYYGDEISEYFGTSLEVIGDINNDSVADFAVGAPLKNTNNGTDSGKVTIYSGKDKVILFHLDGHGAGDRFGASIGALGDVNRDDIPDFIVGAPQHSVCYENAALSCRKEQPQYYSHTLSIDDDYLVTRSGTTVDGSQWIFEQNGIASQIATSALTINLGAGQVRPGDYYRVWLEKKVGTENIIISKKIIFTGSEPLSGNDRGYAEIYSGADQSILFSFNANNGTDNFGGATSNLGDMNNNGKPDVVIAGNKGKVDEIEKGQTHILDSETGEEIALVNGEFEDEEFGTKVVGLPDIDGDGKNDLLVSAIKGGNSKQGSVSILTTNQNDTDVDFIDDTSDNCPSIFNPTQIDANENGLGAHCDENEPLPEPEPVTFIGFKSDPEPDPEPEPEPNPDSDNNSNQEQTDNQTDDTTIRSSGSILYLLPLLLLIFSSTRLGTKAQRH